MCLFISSASALQLFISLSSDGEQKEKILHSLLIFFWSQPAIKKVIRSSITYRNVFLPKATNVIARISQDPCPSLFRWAAFISQSHHLETFHMLHYAGLSPTSSRTCWKRARKERWMEWFSRRANVCPGGAPLWGSVEPAQAWNNVAALTWHWQMSYQKNSTQTRQRASNTAATEHSAGFQIKNKKTGWGGLGGWGLKSLQTTAVLPSQYQFVKAELELCVMSAEASYCHQPALPNLWEAFYSVSVLMSAIFLLLLSELLHQSEKSQQHPSNPPPTHTNTLTQTCLSTFAVCSVGHTVMCKEFTPFLKSHTLTFEQKKTSSWNLAPFDVQ